MTIKDDLHTLINELDDADARETLEFLKARVELEPNVSQAYVADCIAASAEANAPDAGLLPHETVRTWLEAWGTPDEAAADRNIEALEDNWQAKEAIPPAGDCQVVTACLARPWGAAPVHRTRPARGGGANRSAHLATVERLGQYPSYGRAAVWDSRGLLRELPVAGTPFVVVYEVNDTIGAVIILQVVHGALRRGEGYGRPTK